MNFARAVEKPQNHQMTGTLSKSPPFFRRWPLWAAAMVAIAAYYPFFIKREAGLSIFSAAAECMWRGETPLHCYEGLNGLLFVYPPFFALLMTPLTLLPMWLREVIWYLIIVGTLTASLQLCEELARRLFPGLWTNRELALFRILTFVLIAKFILAVLENQAFDSIALTFILLGVLALVSGRSAYAGASLAVAASLKVTPLIFLPYLVWKRRFMAAAIFVSVVVLLTSLPDILLPPKTESHTISWVREVLLAPFFADRVPLMFWVTNSPLNQSIQAAITRILSGTDHSNDFMRVLGLMRSQQFTLIVRGLMSIYLFGIGAMMFKSLKRDRLIPVDAALLIISGLLLSPVSSKSHFIGLMLAYAILAAALVRTPSASNVSALLVSFFLLSLSANDLVGKSFSEWSLWNNLPVFGAFVLVAQLGVLIWSGFLIRGTTIQPAQESGAGESHTHSTSE
jgi:alpha-1,2-mannosyltransferase